MKRTAMLAAVIVGFAIAFLSAFFSPRVQDMGTSDFFVFKVIPIPYWIGVSLIVLGLFLMIPHLGEKRYKASFIFSSILLITCFRMVFPIIFTSVPAFAPDAGGYMTIVNSWVTHGVNFGIDGNYQHDYPLSFLVAFIFVKLGVSIDTFYRIAPFVIYALDIVFLYLLLDELMPEKNKSAIPFVSVFLLSFSSFAYWLTVHYSPDLFGTLMYFLCLYLGIRFAKAGKWTARSLLPVLLSLFLLILAHHLSTLYLIVTFFGLSFSVWFFKPERFKKGALAFFILGIFTYTVWFAFGTLWYPKFFSVYVYFNGFGNGIASQSAVAGLIPNISFAIYPIFIVALFALAFSTMKDKKILKIKKPLSLHLNIREKLHGLRIRESNNILLVFSLGYIFVFILFVVGFAAPVLFGVRILEVLCIGLYPLASLSLIKLAEGKSSRTRVIIFVIILLVVLTGIYRYYSTLQRTVILA